VDLPNGPDPQPLAPVCVILGMALLFMVALSIEQWIDNPDRDLPSESRGIM
jgi:hypothetical protein